MRLPGSPTILRALGAGCILLICVLSLIPGTWQRRTGLPGPVEHVIAYLFTAVILGLAADKRNFAPRIVAFLALLAAVLEVAQNWSPGRDPAIIDFLAGTAGAILGAGCAFLIRGDRREMHKERWKQTRGD